MSAPRQVLNIDRHHVNRDPSAASIVAEGVARIADAAGVVLLVVLGWRMFYSFDADLEHGAFVVAIVGLIAGIADRRAVRTLPVAMLAYVAVALGSAAAHRWAQVGASDDRAWLSLFTTADHLVVMVMFVSGAAYLLRTPGRLSWFVVLMLIAIVLLSIEIAFDRGSTGFVYIRRGPSLPSLPHWGGIHGTSLALTIGMGFASVGLLARDSRLRVAASAILVSGLLVVAYLNGSRGGLVSMGFVAATVALFAVMGGADRKPRPLLLAGALTVLTIVLALGVWVLRGHLDQGDDLSGRTLMWRAAVRLVMDYPWLGVGPANYGQAMAASGYALDFPSYYGGLTNAHNLLLHTAVEVGVIGALCLVLVMVWALRACWRAWGAGCAPMVSACMLLALEGFLIHSQSENFFDARVAVERTRLIVWMLLAAALALDRLSTPQLGRRSEVSR